MKPIGTSKSLSEAVMNGIKKSGIKRDSKIDNYVLVDCIVDSIKEFLSQQLTVAFLRMKLKNSFSEILCDMCNKMEINVPPNTYEDKEV